MRFSDNQINIIKANAMNNVSESDTWENETVVNLIDTIEALQQENEQLKDENASLRNWNACEEELHNELLESDKRRWELESELEDANNYRAGLEAIVDKLRAHVMRMSEILSAAHILLLPKQIEEVSEGAPDYHNPADVEALRR